MRSANGLRSITCPATASGRRTPSRRAAISPSVSARARASCCATVSGASLLHRHQPLRSRKRLWPRSDPLAPTEDPMGDVDSDRRSGRVRLLNPPTLEATMQDAAPRAAQAAIRTDLGAIFISLELSRSSWVITSLSPGAGEKMSKHSVAAGDIADLLKRFAQLKEKARGRTGKDFPVIVIQEAGLDGFWIHRVLGSDGIETHVVDPASILTSRRRRRAKTDKIDGETLVRTLLAYKRGEPRVCSMVKAPSPEEEDRRRICRERKTLV